MTARTLKIELRFNYPVFLVLVFLCHLSVAIISIPSQRKSFSWVNRELKSPLKILTLGESKGSKRNNIYLDPKTPPNRVSNSLSKKLTLSDLTSPPNSVRTIPELYPKIRPGKGMKPTPALSGLRYDASEFKKMIRDPLFQGSSKLINSEKIALNFEVPEGKKADELNESQLKLYGFLRRGAMKYVNSLSLELKEFELKNPHLQFPMTDNKQIMTGRLVYDSEGNLKQIKMVRWTNIDRLQGFFENVVKRLEQLQNPPKELWAENGEFTIYVTLQING